MACIFYPGTAGQFRILENSYERVSGVLLFQMFTCMIERAIFLLMPDSNFDEAEFGAIIYFIIIILLDTKGTSVFIYVVHNI